jgi:flagellar basal-body rod protein FlgG
VDTLRIVDFKRVRYLEKQGASLWRTSDESGEAASIPEPERPAVHQGFLEAANVNPVTSMVEMIEVNRAYEANQRLIRTEDNLLGRLINETTKV